MGKLKAIIFDVDGTLADTERDGHMVACNEASERMGFDIRWTWEEFKEVRGIPGRHSHALPAHSGASTVGKALC